jgi:tripartite-type tricarboxylate transporter receptor subunit TctC
MGKAPAPGPLRQAISSRRTNLPRRAFLRLAAAAAALPLVRSARAQAYPSRPVRVVESYGPASSSDIMARLIAQWLSQRLGQSFVVENRAGANGTIATDHVVRASADGYTLLLALTSHTINNSFYDKLTFDFMRDIAPVAGISRVPLVMEVNPSVPAKTVPEFIAYAKANPGKINMASAGTASITHVAGELFKMLTGVDMLHVPYRGVQALVALLSGEAQVLFVPVTSSVEHIKAGRLRPLAVTTARRSPLLPDVPPVGDFVADYEASAWFGLGAPKDTPADVLDTLGKAVDAALADGKFTARLADVGGVPLPLARADFAKLVAEDTAKWAKVVKFAGMKAG